MTTIFGGVISEKQLRQSTEGVAVNGTDVKKIDSYSTYYSYIFNMYSIYILIL